MSKYALKLSITIEENMIIFPGLSMVGVSIFPGVSRINLQKHPAKTPCKNTPQKHPEKILYQGFQGFSKVFQGCGHPVGKNIFL